MGSFRRASAWGGTAACTARPGSVAQHARGDALGSRNGRAYAARARCLRGRSDHGPAIVRCRAPGLVASADPGPVRAAGHEGCSLECADVGLSVPMLARCLFSTVPLTVVTKADKYI